MTKVGSAGGAEKIEYLRSIGVQHVIDYKSVGDMTQALRDLAPDGIDPYFDNGGGDHLDAALACARNFARFALCGMISGYNGESACPRNLLMAIEKRLFLQGFLVSDHLSDRARVHQANGRVAHERRNHLSADGGTWHRAGACRLPEALLRREHRQDAREVVATLLFNQQS
jgi:NADPH-dependent curcumin reductase CurA